MQQYFAIATLISGVTLVSAMVWMEKRPRDGFKVSLIPTTPFMFAGAIIAIMAVAWLLSIYGISLPERGRF